MIVLSFQKALIFQDSFSVRQQAEGMLIIADFLSNIN